MLYINFLVILYVQEIVYEMPHRYDVITYRPCLGEYTRTTSYSSTAEYEREDMCRQDLSSIRSQVISLCSCLCMCCILYVQEVFTHFIQYMTRPMIYTVTSFNKKFISQPLYF